MQTDGFKSKPRISYSNRNVDFAEVATNTVVVQMPFLSKTNSLLDKGNRSSVCTQKTHTFESQRQETAKTTDEPIADLSQENELVIDQLPQNDTKNEQKKRLEIH